VDARPPRSLPYLLAHALAKQPGRLELLLRLRHVGALNWYGWEHCCLCSAAEGRDEGAKPEGGQEAVRFSIGFTSMLGALCVVKSLSPLAKNPREHAQGVLGWPLRFI
jgi:hypothetical protein